MITDMFASVEPAWLNVPEHDNGADSIPVVSTVKIRRNIAGFPFSSKCSKSDLFDIAAMALGAVGKSDMWNGCDFRMIDNLDSFSKNLLVESRLMSKKLANGGAGRFLMHDADGLVGCMINEEDHITMTASATGLEIGSAYDKAANLERSLDFQLATDTVLGYFTANPNYVGLGATVSVLLHLPALELTGEMRKLSGIFDRDWKKVTLYKMVTDANNSSGSFYMLENSVTLGISTEEVIGRIRDAAQSLASKEIYARQKIANDRNGLLVDKFWRAWGLLRHARQLSFSEAMDTFSAVKLGSDLGILPKITNAEWIRTVIGTQRYHLALNEEQIIDPADDATYRATKFRQFIESKNQLMREL